MPCDYLVKSFGQKNTILPNERQYQPERSFHHHYIKTLK